PGLHIVAPGNFGPMSVVTSSATLPRATPESQGLSSAAVLAFLDAAAEQGPAQELHTLMILRRGKVVAEGWWHPYAPERRHLLFSLSKSFMASAIGIAVGEGVLGLDDQVISFFPDRAPANPSENLAAMTVRHLLTMSTGHSSEPWPNLDGRNARDWVASFLNHPVEYEPGSKFLYNSIATFMLSAILQRLTGVAALDYLRPRLLAPLGIGEATWDLNPDGIVVGGWGLSICTESIAKFGELYLRDGVWDGRRLLPEGWVADATRSHIDNGPNENADWGGGYGYQFWRCQHDCYRADGAFGQLSVVMPYVDMVVAITARVEFIHKTLDLIWEHLLPEARGGALAKNAVAQADLARRLSTLAIRGPSGEAASPSESTVSGVTYESSDPDFSSMRWVFAEEGCTLSFTVNDERFEVAAGRNAWTVGECGFQNERKQPVAAWGSWIAHDTYAVCLQYLEEPGSIVLTAVFTGSRVSVSTQRRGRFVDPAGPTFEGVGR
ncbi:MAG: serine hydrolase domain-containing protein, partial [Fimbriimonadaceae bacterium]